MPIGHLLPASLLISPNNRSFSPTAQLTSTSVPDRTRTCDLLLRRQSLYPPELRRQPTLNNHIIISLKATLKVILFVTLCSPVGVGGQLIPSGITDITGIKLGHYNLKDRPTGCTVVVIEKGAVGGVDVRGGAPATVETDLLDPINTVQSIHAIFVSGGSAFGLATRDGVMQYLEESNIGYLAGGHLIPLVAGAAIYDLQIGGSAEVKPGPECGYRASLNASASYTGEGNLGAGYGATVGKLKGIRYSMKGGSGTASVTLDSGLTVGALVVVNAVGDILDPSTGEILAGTLSDDRKTLADARILIRENNMLVPDESGTNTTIAIVATNAKLSKSQVTKVAQMAQDGIARAIYPSHTTRDGDAVFSLATGTFQFNSDVSIIGSLAADMIVESILRALNSAESLKGIPSVNDLNDR